MRKLSEGLRREASSHELSASLKLASVRFSRRDIQSQTAVFLRERKTGHPKQSAIKNPVLAQSGAQYCRQAGFSFRYPPICLFRE